MQNMNICILKKQHAKNGKTLNTGSKNYSSAIKQPASAFPEIKFMIA